MITSFRGQYDFLSNFYPVEVKLDGIIYPTVEHAYQAAKTLSPAERATILAFPFPGQAKRMGRRLAFIQPNWDDIKLDIMRRLVKQKFQNEYLPQLLLATGDERLVEGNTWGDRFWGQCPVGLGHNHLGKILMDIRQQLKG